MRKELTSMKTIYGYASAPNGLLQIIPEQAAIVQKIYVYHVL